MRSVIKKKRKQHSTSHGITFQNKYTMACAEKHLYKGCLNAPSKIREAENEDKKTHPHVWHFAVCRLKRRRAAKKVVFLPVPPRGGGRTLYIREFGITKTCSANYRYAVGDEIAIRFLSNVIEKASYLIPISRNECFF